MRLEDLVARVVRKTAQEIRVAMPAIVESFDPATRLARVRLIQSDRTQDGLTIEQPVITDVPVFMPGGAVSFPVKPGDEGMVHFADQDIGGWAVDGDTSGPDTGRRHSLTDAMFTPGVGRGSVDADNVVISFGGATITLSPGGAVTISAPGGLAITGPSVTHNGVNIGDTHVHGGVTVGGADTEAPS